MLSYKSVNSNTLTRTYFKNHFTIVLGVEVAAALVDTAKSVTIVDLVEAPFQLALGKEIGEGVKKVGHRNTLTLYMYGIGLSK